MRLHFNHHKPTPERKTARKIILRGIIEKDRLMKAKLEFKLEHSNHSQKVLS